MRVTSIIRLATAADAQAIAGIYAPFVTDTAISFELVPPDAGEMAGRIADTLTTHPWLACERGGQVLGYAYATQHRARLAYQWSTDVSVYILPEHHRRGIGAALYTSLFALLTLQGFYNAYGGITLPNPASVGLHESLGFTLVGVYTAVGYKLGAWHDVGWWHKPLQPPAASPSPPLTLAAAQASPGWEAALGAGLKLLRL